MDNRTNSDWIQAFAAYLRRRFPQRSTATHYTSDLRIFEQFHTGPLTEVTVQDVDRFVEHQYALGMTPATVKRRVAALKTFFDFLAEEIGAPERPNPVSLRRHAGRLPRHLPRDLSDAEVERFLAVVQEPRDQAMIALMLYAGLRVSEVQGLRWADIIVPEEPSAPVRLRVMGKGRKERTVYLSREGYRFLEAYRAQQPEVDPDQPVFRNHRGQPITIGGIQERIHHYAQVSGVPVTCHRLRHTFGRWMAEGGMPVLVLARLLGHASVQTTQRYIEGADLQVRRHYEAAMERWNALDVLPEGEETSSGPSVVVAAGPVTVRRAVPTGWEGKDWMPEAPAWLREGCLNWIRHKWGRWKPSRRREHAKTRLKELRIFWRWRLAHRPLAGWDDVTAEDMAAFVSAQLSRGLKPKTVKDYLDTVYELLRYLVERGELAEVPRRPVLRLPEPLPQHLSPQEVLALERYVAQREEEATRADWLDLALYSLLAHGGLRLSEVLDLEVGDLDLVSGRVWVREGKGRRDRVVYLTRVAVRRLRRYLETVPHAAGDLVLSWKGKPLSEKGVRWRIRRLGEAAGVKGLTPRRLRHTYATQLLNHGMSLEGLRQLMGHEDLNTTLIYARLVDQTVEHQYRVAMSRITGEVETNLM